IGATQVTTDANGDAAVQATFPVAIPNGVQMSATATDSGNNTSVFSSDHVAVKAASADLSISITTSPTTPTLGDTLTYTITVTNNSPDAASGLVLRDALPDVPHSDSVTPSQGTYYESEGIVICFAGNLASGASATLTIVVSPLAAGTISDSAEVSANETDPFL